MVRINSVYTRTGDSGDTGLVGGARAPKDDLRIEAYGTVDELNATLGMVRSALATSAAGDHMEPIIARIQNELFDLGATLATPDPQKRAQMPSVGLSSITRLEDELDAMNDELPELKSFVLPGGGPVSAVLHLARTIARRAERRVVTLAREGGVGEYDVPYLNRLSDALFVFGRWAAKVDGHTEPLWRPTKA